MRCKHCGTGLQYYANIEHSSRRSCLNSTTGYHYFVTDIYYLFYTVYSNCLSVSKDAVCTVQTPLRPILSRGETNRPDPIEI